MPKKYDVIIIGAGVIGSAVARELGRYRLKVLVLEKDADVARGASGANSGVVHAGFNVPAGSLKARFNIEGNRMFPKFARELGIPFKRVGKIVVARKKSELTRLKELKKVGVKNGVQGLHVIGKKDLFRLEPNISGIAALYVPTSGITCPFHMTIALAEHAHQNGVAFRFNSKVLSIKKRADGFLLRAHGESFLSDIVVNSAGIFADEISRMVGINRYRLTPNRGEYLMLDKEYAHLINQMIYPVPKKKHAGLGIHLTPTIDGNILIGPSNEYILDRSDSRTTARVFDRLITEAKIMLPKIPKGDFIQGYAGIRSKHAKAKTEGFADYVIEEDPEIKGFFNLIGIESPGLTAAPAIGKHVASLIARWKKAKRKSRFHPYAANDERFARLNPIEQARRVSKHRDDGDIVCRCEYVTRREILNAIRNPFGASSLSAIKIRTRATMGRCHGGFCMPKIVEILDKEFGYDLKKLVLKNDRSHLFVGRTKGLRR